MNAPREEKITARQVANQFLIDEFGILEYKKYEGMRDRLEQLLQTTWDSGKAAGAEEQRQGLHEAHDIEFNVLYPSI